MNILIDDGMQIDIGTGIGKYTENLYKNLQNCDNIKVELQQNHNTCKKKIMGRIKYLLYINSRNYRKKTKNYDIVHFTNFLIPFYRNKNVKYAVTIHDLVSFKYPETLPSLFRIYSRFITKYAIKHADLIFTVSNSVKEEIKNKFPKYKEKIKVAYPGLYDEMSNESNKSEYDNLNLREMDNKFFLYVGTIEKRKNIDFVVRAFLELKEKKSNDYKLVLAGKPGYGFEEIKEVVDKSKYKGDIIFTGYISNEDCCKLYDNASAYIFPTIYEGFGSTQLECMIHHTPLILSDIPTNIEVSKEYGLFFYLSDIKSLITQMEIIIDLKYDIEQKEKVADEIVEKFKWKNVINDYIIAYESINKIKICHVIGDFINGGVESVIYNYFSHMDLTKFDVSIIGHGITIKECADNFYNLGFKIYNVTPKRVSFRKNIREMNKIIKENNFDIIHSHLTEWACVPLALGYFNRVKVRINHSHMAEKKKGLKNQIYYGTRLILGRLFATDYFACGRDAGIYLFGKRNLDSGKVHIMYNAIDMDKFKFNNTIREEMRRKNNIEEKEIVIGHVGRFFEQKNHKFLIDVFKELYKVNKNVRLYLFGDGELLENIKNYVLENNLKDVVHFMGVRKDIYNWYQAMDVFILPSLYEGLPVVGIEAQVSGLLCYFSSEITDEVKITDKAKILPLDLGCKTWSQYINEGLKNNKRNNIAMKVEQKYDIIQNAIWLEKFYIDRAKGITNE